MAFRGLGFREAWRTACIVGLASSKLQDFLRSGFWGFAGGYKSQDAQGAFCNEPGTPKAPEDLRSASYLPGGWEDTASCFAGFSEVLCLWFRTPPSAVFKWRGFVSGSWGLRLRGPANMFSFSPGP